MSLVRVFIAIDIPPALQSAIDQKTRDLRAAADTSLVRWVKSGNLHLTLKFFGDVSSTSIPFITQMLTSEAAKSKPFQIQIGNLGSFPTSKRPRVIWVGIQAPAALEALYHGIDSAAHRLGYVSEARPFSPHLTIGRVRPNLSGGDLQSLQVALSSHEIGTIGKAEIHEVHLIKSDLQPEGSIYTRLVSAPVSK